MHNIQNGTFSALSIPALITLGAGSGGEIVEPSAEEIAEITRGAKSADKIGARSGIEWNNPGERSDKTAPCGYVQAPGLPYGCLQDDHGRTWVRCGGQLLEIMRPQTCRERVLPARLRFDMVTADGDRIFNVIIAPTVRYFKPTSLIMTGSFASATGLALENVSITKIEISNRVQNTSKIDSAEGVDAYNAGIVATAFGAGAFNNLFDFDVAEPSLGVQVSGVIDTAAANGRVVLGIHFFGLTWEA